jgi:hypothetical protein
VFVATSTAGGGGAASLTVMVKIFDLTISTTPQMNIS